MKKIILALLVLLFLAITYMYLSTSLFLSVLQKNKAKQTIIENTRNELGEFTDNIGYKAKKITDRAGLFSVEVPSGWDVTVLGPQINRISGILAGNSKKGIKFGIIVSEEKRKISSKDKPLDVVVDSLNAKYYTIEIPKLARKKMLAVEFSDKNKYYFLSLTYNPKKYPEGQDVFENILSSFDILDVKEGVKINSIKVISSDLNPVQVNVLVKGEFANSCTELGEITEEQEGDIFSVNLYTKKNNNKNCILAPVLFEKTISLDTIGLNPGEYLVDISGITAKFKIPEKTE